MKPTLDAQVATIDTAGAGQPAEFHSATSRREALRSLGLAAALAVATQQAKASGSWVGAPGSAPAGGLPLEASAGSRTEFLGLHHASITISDMERSLAFYRDLLGLRVTLDERLAGPFISAVMGYPATDMRVAFLDPGEPTARIELLEMRHPREAGPAPAVNHVGGTHLALLVDDIAGLYARLTAAGVRFRGSPQEGPAFWAVHCFDPDGISVEFVQLKP